MVEKIQRTMSTRAAAIILMVLLAAFTSSFHVARAHAVIEPEQLTTPVSVEQQNETAKLAQLKEQNLESESALLDDITDLNELSEADRAKLMAAASSTTASSDEVPLKIETVVTPQTDKPIADNLVKSETESPATTTTTVTVSTTTINAEIEQMATVRHEAETTSTRRIETSTVSTLESTAQSDITESPITAPPPPTRAHTIKVPDEELNVHYEPNSTDRSPDQVKPVVTAESQIGQPPVQLSTPATPQSTTTTTTQAPVTTSVSQSNNIVREQSTQESNTTQESLSVSQESSTVVTTTTTTTALNVPEQVTVTQAQVTEKPREVEIRATTTQETTTPVTSTHQAPTTPQVVTMTVETTTSTTTTTTTTMASTTTASNPPEIIKEEEIRVETDTPVSTTIASTIVESVQTSTEASQEEETTTVDSRAPVDSVPPTPSVVTTTSMPVESSSTTTTTTSSPIESNTTTTEASKVESVTTTVEETRTESVIAETSTEKPEVKLEEAQGVPNVETSTPHHPTFSQRLNSKLRYHQSRHQHHHHHNHGEHHHHDHVHDANNLKAEGEAKKEEEKREDEGQQAEQKVDDIKTEQNEEKVIETSTKKPYIKLNTVSESDLNEEIVDNDEKTDQARTTEEQAQESTSTVATPSTDQVLSDHHHHEPSNHVHENSEIDHSAISIEPALVHETHVFDFDSEIKWCLNASPVRLFLAKYLHAIYSPIVQMLPDQMRTLLDMNICKPIGLNVISLVLLGNTALFFFASWYALIRQAKKKQARVVISLNEQLIVLFNNQKQLEFQNKAYMKLIGDMETRQAYSANMRNKSSDGMSRGASVSSEPDSTALVQQFEARLASLKQANDGLHKNLQQAQSNEQSLASQIANLHEQAQKQTEEYERHKADLEFQIGQMNQALQEFNKRVLEDDEKLVAYDQLVREQQVRLESAQHELVDRENTITMLKTNLLGKLTQIVAKSADTSSASDDNDMEVIDKSELLSEEDQAEPASKLLESLMNLGQLESELKKLRETLKSTEDEKSQKVSECLSLTSQLADQTENMQALESRVKRMERTIKENEIQIRLLGELREQDAKQHLRSLSELDAQLKKKTTESEKVSHLLEQLRLKQERIHELESQTNRVEKQSNVERQTFEKQIHENWLNSKKLDKQLKEATNEVATLNQRLADLEVTNRNLQTELSMLKQMGPVHQVHHNQPQQMTTPLTKSLSMKKEESDESRASSAYLVQESELNDSLRDQQQQGSLISAPNPRPPSVASNPGHFAGPLNSPSYTYMGQMTSPIRYPAFPPPMMNPMAFMQSQQAAANPEMLHQQQQQFQQMMYRMPYMMASPSGFAPNQQMTQSAPTGYSGDPVSPTPPPPMYANPYQTAQLAKDRSYDSLYSQEGMMKSSIHSEPYEGRMNTSSYSDQASSMQHHADIAPTSGAGGYETGSEAAQGGKYDETSSTNSNFNV